MPHHTHRCSGDLESCNEIHCCVGRVGVSGGDGVGDRGNRAHNWWRRWWWFPKVNERTVTLAQ